MSDPFVFQLKHLSEYRLARLQHVGDQLTGSNFELGRTVREIREEFDAEGVELEVMSLYRTVAHAAGCSPEHVRQCFDVEKKTPDEYQNHELFGFYHCKAIAPHTQGREDRETWDNLVRGWEQYCERPDTPDDKRRVSALRQWLQERGNGGPTELELWERLFDRVMDDLGALERRTPEGVARIGVRGASETLRTLRSAAVAALGGSNGSTPEA